ncbi:MAG: ribosome maturation factor RimP [Pseudomonadota bacterium]
MSDLSKLEKIIEPVIGSMGYELWGLDCNPHSSHVTLKIFIDSDQGVNLDDCTKVSEHISAMLDVEDPIGSSYTLEVSSPGVDRILLKDEHFMKYIGEDIFVQLKWLVNGRRKITGTIKSIDDGELCLQIDNEEFFVPTNSINNACLKQKMEKYE